MKNKKYSVEEMDIMSEMIGRKLALNKFLGRDDIANPEDRLRTFMANSTTPKEMYQAGWDNFHITRQNYELVGEKWPVCVACGKDAESFYSEHGLKHKPEKRTFLARLLRR